MKVTLMAGDSKVYVRGTSPTIEMTPELLVEAARRASAFQVAIRYRGIGPLPADLLLDGLGRFTGPRAFRNRIACHEDIARRRLRASGG
jgi:hypothetical protein